MNRKILVVDIGGSNVKLMISPEEKRKFPSGKNLTPGELIARIREATADWDYEAVSLGFPSALRDGAILKEPKNLGKGWLGFEFEKSLGKPTRVVNDAALQALGSYSGEGRMLFLGLGTGLGSALVWPGFVLSLELGFLPYVEEGIIEDQLGDAGLKKLRKKVWRKETRRAIAQLKIAFIADRVILGGGNAKHLEELPEGVELGHNRHVYPGGVRLWEMEPDGRTPEWKVL